MIKHPKLGKLDVDPKLSPCTRGKHRTMAHPGLYPNKQGRPVLAWYCVQHGLIDVREIDKSRLTLCRVDTSLIDAARVNIVEWTKPEYEATVEEQQRYIRLARELKRGA